MFPVSLLFLVGIRHAYTGPTVLATPTPRCASTLMFRTSWSGLSIGSPPPRRPREPRGGRPRRARRRHLQRVPLKAPAAGRSHHEFHSSVYIYTYQKKNVVKCRVFLRKFTAEKVSPIFFYVCRQNAYRQNVYYQHLAFEIHRPVSLPYRLVAIFKTFPEDRRVP